ncbi:YqaA family protein [Wenzhouxiangella sp. XN24]|uniref:YqaA family protein n=1 Tax=Wenzhouxiangella sp. XN24 TaxID=2713569 RepID=UPI0013E9F244|nr:YqaA family protein [Wenzhouxiangella sp. XN24]NGX16339.1 DedA family protein [Wenzhouxiangella sp. XN24]
MSVYVGLFLTSFFAATLLPAYSEILFGGLLIQGYDPLALWLWASTGNTLGSAVNWALARFFLRYKDRRWFPFRETKLARAQQWFQRYGVWSLLMAWAPIGGDALTFVAGLMRVRFWLFLVLVAIGKGTRYAVVLWLVFAAQQTAA